MAEGDKKGIGMVKWVGRAYEGNLRRRREGAMRDGNVGGGGSGEGRGIVAAVEGGEGNEREVGRLEHSEEKMNEVD